MMKRWQQFICLFCLGVVLSVASSGLNMAQAQEAQTPTAQTQEVDSFLECVPELKDYPDRYILLHTEYEGLHYYTIGVNRLDRVAEEAEGDARTPPPEKRYWEVTLSVNPKGECTVLVARNQPFDTLMEFMPKEAAYQLALQRIKRYVEEDKGTRKMQEQIDRLSKTQASFDQRSQRYGSSYPIVTLAPEIVWAYQQVGINVPKNIPVYPEPKQDSNQPERTQP